MTELKDRYLQAILDEYPDPSINHASLNSWDGQYNDLLLINDQLIFRFPKFEAGLPTLLREIALLKQIQGMLPLTIPNPQYVSRDMETVGGAFMGYPKINGEPLWHDLFQSITNQKILAKLAAQLASFLRELHTIPIDQLEIALPCNDLPGEWENLYH